MNNWRIIPNIEDSGARQMAIDESILKARSLNLVPNTLRFFKWRPSAVTIGFFQDLEQEIDVQKAEELGVDIVRRYTGGGAVFHESEITYSLVVSERDVNLNIEDSYRYLCSGIVFGLKSLGLNAEFKPINDIIINNKKISGNAQTRKNGVILQHGTILLSVDVEKMFSLLKVPDEKIKDKLIKSVKERVTCLKTELNNELLDYNKLVENFINSFSQSLSASFIASELSAGEKKDSDILYKNKYSNANWNYFRKYEEN